MTQKKWILMNRWWFYGIFLLFGLPILSHARWLSLEEAPTEHSFVQEIKVARDGTHSIIIEERKKILNEMGKNSTSTEIFYQEDRENIEILEAKTIYKGKDHPLDKKFIEDKPVASNQIGFDKYRKILLAFPKIEIGSIICIKYKFTLKEPILKDFFSKLFYFGDQKLLTKGRVTIDSELPLYFSFNDPSKALRISNSRVKALHKLEIVLTKPIYNQVTQESNGIINDKQLTWISVSSLKQWKEFALQQSEPWEKIFKQVLPPDFLVIANLAKQKDSEIEQIETVIALLNNKIRYLGDWRSNKGRYFPRSLEEISSTQFGDCKDFSAITAAILNNLGFKVNFALVNRGMTSVSPDFLPGFHSFNHVILKVIGKQEKIYWIDPTNLISMADGIFPDIADKMALVLDTKNPIYQKIPAINFKEARSCHKRIWNIEKDGTINERGEIIWEKETALNFTEIMFEAPVKVVEDAIFYFLADNKQVEEKKRKFINLPKTVSRKLKTVDLTYAFTRNNEFLLSNLGKVLKITNPELISTIAQINDQYVSDVLISNYPTTRKKITTIKNIQLENFKALNKKVQSPWLELTRDYRVEGNDLKIEDTIIIYKNLISNQEIKTEEFKCFKEKVENNFRDAIVIETFRK